MRLISTYSHELMAAYVQRLVDQRQNKAFLNRSKHRPIIRHFDFDGYK
jgi:hypothetical protein